MEIINNMKNKNLIYSFVTVIVFIIVLVFSLKSVEAPKETISLVQIGKMDVKVELAVTKEEQVKGLSGRESLSEDSGMLFIFPKPSKYYFWMKDMHFPIDIVWINENKEIIYIKQDAQPDDFLETYGPEQDSSYVLEVVSGFIEKHKVKVGDKVLFQK
jgi:uncharacterized membrane protein (UPF0127 family)